MGESHQECALMRAAGAYDNLMSQGAEGRVFRVTFLGQPSIIKQRFTKKYRHPDLDAKITKSRLQGEARALLKARKFGVVVPTLYYVDTESNSLYMELVPGISAKQHVQSAGMDAAGLAALAIKIGKAVALLHDGGVVHGDLTTSNMLLRESDGALVLIDFGLSYNTLLPEDKAVDLYVLERAIASAHCSATGLFDGIIDEYRKSSRFWNPVLNRFADVRMRGRKRSMVG